MGLLSVEDLCALVVALCSGYLALRLLAVIARVRWARRAYLSVERVHGDGDERGFGDRARGALVGLALGDALCMPAESLPRWLVRLRYRGGPAMRRGLLRLTRRAGDVTDDTQLTICVAKSIDPQGVYLHRRFIDELRIWYGYRVGAGRACSRAARRLARAQRALDAEVSATSSEGNGAAIRVAPLAIAASAGRWTEAELIARVKENASATHQTEAGQRAAVLVALLIRRSLRADLLAGDQATASRRIVDVAERSGFDVEPFVRTASRGLDDALATIGTSGHVAQSVNAALAIFVRCGLDFGRAMRTCFFAGGDTDSVAAMVGALLGAQLGCAALPKDDRLQHRALLMATADRLAAPRAPVACAGEVVEVRGDIARREVDVLVNAWNRNIIPAWLLLPQGVSKAIRRAGGRRAILDISRQAPLPLGAAAATAGGDLSARWVIHVAGINMAWRSSPTSVRLSTRNALLLARQLGARSMALPLIGAGSGGMSADEVKALMRLEIDAERQHFDLVEIVSYSPRS